MKLRTLLFVAIAVALLFVSNGAIIEGSAATAPTYGSTACADQIRSNVRSLSPSLDVQKAISLATGSTQHNQESENFQLTFTDTASIWSFNKQCTVTALKYENVYFLAANFSGTVGNFVITETANLSKVISAEFQPYTVRNLVTDTSWSGYEMFGNSAATSPIYEVTAEWYVPSATAPSGGCSFACDLSIWPGMTAQEAGTITSECSTPCLIQAGTDTCLASGNECQSYPNENYYDAWWETLGGNPSNAQFCAGFPVQAGDQMYIDIYNEAENGGSVNQYQIYIDDFRSGLQCTPNNGQPITFSMGTPYYADYAAEAVDTLPNFGSVSMTGLLYYSGSLQGIYNPFSNYWYNTAYLWPSGCSGPDITYGAVSGGGTFTFAYQSSCGT